MVPIVTASNPPASSFSLQSTTTEGSHTILLLRSFLLVNLRSHRIIRFPIYHRSPEAGQSQQTCFQEEHKTYEDQSFSFNYDQIALSSKIQRSRNRFIPQEMKLAGD
ncbi:hypothetical protein L1887_32195 [Cichorium endivia]|nr:hypothetical protein L1887_32195 [Cichorium endivia]